MKTENVELVNDLGGGSFGLFKGIIQQLRSRD
jgi:hypothetical protein